MAFVVDASVAAGWVLPSQADPLTAAAANALTRDIGWVPSHFGIEVARTLRRHERRGVIAPNIVDRALAGLRDLPLKQDSIRALDLAPRIVGLARGLTLRVADAAYLELALRLDLPLATRDEALARATVKAGARLFTG
jgi:predicted nucleic acid-binding protein